MGLFTRKRRINLALQGGGAHGAFTWGVLDRLLEESALELGWVSGTSAGAVNAVAMASGLASEGTPAEARAKAREKLKRVWDAVESAGVSDLVKLNPFLWGLTKASGLSSMGSLLSPYDFNPLGWDPFRKLLETSIDFQRLREHKSSTMELLIAATDVATGRPRVFRRAELAVEAVLASACLPQIHHAVEIDGRAYWDGGFSANPDILTLATESPVEDTLIVQLNPLDRLSPPRTARDIAAQVNTLTFNQPLIKDVEIVVAAQAEIATGWFRRRQGRLARLARHRFHLIDAGRHTASLGADSKATPDKQMLAQLFRAGRMETARFLERHGADIGQRQTVDLAQRYLAGRDRIRTEPSPLPPETRPDTGGDLGGAPRPDQPLPAGSKI